MLGVVTRKPIPPLYIEVLVDTHAKLQDPSDVNRQTGAEIFKWLYTKAPADTFQGFANQARARGYQI